MKINNLNDVDFQIYLFDRVHISIEEVENLLYDLRKQLKLNGFYHVTVINKNIGIFIGVKKIQNSYYKKVLDLKIVFEDLEDIYYKTSDYFIVSDYSEVYYLDGYYYVLVDDNFNKVLEKSEFGEFIFGYDRLSFLDNCGIV